MLTQYINQILSILTILSQIGLLVAILILLFFKNRFRYYLLYFFNKYAIRLIFIISLSATLGSLYYSEIAGYIPCELCWYQRIFMYPQVFISGLSLYKNDMNIVKHTLLLSIIGGVFSLYHSYITYWERGVNTCSGIGGISCLQRYVFELGYITIPLMALTSFALIISISSVHLYLKNSKWSYDIK